MSKISKNLFIIYRYSYKVEDSASYRRLSQLLMAEQSSIYKALLWE